MTFLKPNRLILSIFSLLFLLLINPLLRTFFGIEVTTFSDLFTAIFYFFSVTPLFIIFETLGVDMGGTSDFFGIPILGFFGWIITLFIWTVVYYIIASRISSRIADGKKRRIVFYILFLISATYVCLVVFYSIALVKQGRPIVEMIKLEQECQAQAEPAKKACVAACEPFLGPESDGKTLSPEEYRTCTSKCFIIQENFIKECIIQYQPK